MLPGLEAAAGEARWKEANGVVGVASTSPPRIGVVGIPSRCACCVALRFGLCGGEAIDSSASGTVADVSLSSGILGEVSAAGS